MSLLADLLSKKNGTEPSGAKDIPPTLARSHDAPAKVRSLKSRYIAVAGVSAVAVMVGAVVALQSERLIKLVAGTPAPAVQAARPLPAAPLIPAEPKAAEPVQAATVSPTAAVEVEKAVEPQVVSVERAPKKKVKAKTVRHRRAGDIGSPQQVPVVLSARNVEPAQKIHEVATSGKIDTAKRDSYLYAARSAEQASDWRLALNNYRKAQKIDPDNYVIMNNASAALNNLGMFDEGAKEARRALGRKPDYVPAMVNAAIACSSRGNNQEALQLFSDAALADPGNRSLIINLGIQQERAGRLEEAQATYRPLVDDADPLALLGTGRIFERKGNRNEAVRIYRQIMTLSASEPATRKEVKSRLLRLEE